MGHSQNGHLIKRLKAINCPYFTVTRVADIRGGNKTITPQYG